MKKTDEKTKTSRTSASKKATGSRTSNTSVAKGLRDLFIDSLKDIYWAEKALTKAIPKMVKNATSEDLQEALTEHLEATKEHVLRLEEIFSILGEKATAKKCEAMEGLIKEADSIIEETTQGAVRDAGIIAAGQKVEHYEIATYGTLCAFARVLEEDDALALLEDTLEEEKEADIRMSEIAEADVNKEALGIEDE